MSDAETVRFYLDKRDDLAGWLALNRLEAQVWALQDERESLESQNQALQEERDLLQSRLSGQTKLTGMLQERAEKAEALLRRIWKEGLYEDQTSELIEAFFGPTQETDPDASM